MLQTILNAVYITAIQLMSYNTIKKGTKKTAPESGLNNVQINTIIRSCCQNQER